jgi:tRNA pseudouridine32 synthase / 23S rRNA pseudouridine746 synthase
MFTMHPHTSSTPSTSSHPHHASHSAAFNASTWVQPQGRWPSLLTCLIHHFAGIPPATWRSRFERGLVLDARRNPLALDTPHQPGARIFYFREVADEPEIPLYETILYQDEHLLVADKPHFLPVLPTGEYVTQTLLNRLMLRLGNQELQPLHRLDRHTAGLVLFSVQRSSRAAYQGLFRDRTISKRYEAIAPALPQLDFPHRRSSRIERGERFFLSQEVSGVANAHTEIEVLERRGTLWRYGLNPISGKKHQLRLHMAALGAPICNDSFYPVVNDDLSNDYQHPLQLLAKELRFVDPISGAERHFTSQRTLSWSLTCKG